jgi:hypothetical protein
MLKRTIFMLTAVLLGGACNNAKSSKGGPIPNEGFQYDDTVRILSPIDGATVAGSFSLSYEAGEAVHSVTLESASGLVNDTPTEGAGSFAVGVLLDGHWNLELTGFDAEGEVLKSHTISVRIAAPADPWVTITSPLDGAETENPVVFAVDATEDIESVELFADDWSLGTFEPGQIFSYTFEGTGFVRSIDAVGYAGGEAIATDTIAITVQASEEVAESDMNSIVWGIASGYPTDGTHTYYWPSDGDWAGTTQDIWYRDQLVAEGDPEGRSFCVGLTWEVYMLAFAQADEETDGDGTINGMSVSDLYTFRTDHYVRDLLGSGVVEAFENYGIGQEVTDWEDAQQGDFIQLWRNNSTGHSVLFESWERDTDGSIQGVNYWSTQNSTDGIGLSTEWFGTTEWDINPTYFFLARPWAPVDWLPW